MKKVIFVMVFLFGMTTSAQSRTTLVNKNTKTRGITKMKLYTNSQNRTYIDIYAKCSPKDCHWGRFSTIKDAAYSEKMRRGINPAQYYGGITIKEPFAIRKAIILKYRGVDSYKVIVTTDYINPDRKDRTKTEMMTVL